MIHLSTKIPNQIAIAVSGGPDSMAALDFLSRNKDVSVLHFNHGTDHSDEAQQIVSDYCAVRDIPLTVGTLNEQIKAGQSREDFWRKSRYRFFEQEAGRLSVITCHHLDDVVETWLFTSMHGNPRLIPTRRGRYLRPFLGTRKTTLEDWCDRKSVPYVIDPSNSDISFMRNYIRHEIVPRAVRVNPGLTKVLRKKIINSPVIFEEAF
ncbi:MAG TPA: tRNA lysidine(34) synthetase TilS [Flavobacteriales bacterium]|jgi:tRNA(Ile)-lysidine synthase|nr:tRNA lysidine(34) synthetase TilS [Flavobacteriales bacterium]